MTSYPQWVANVVPVPKKDGKVRTCVNYRDLNRAIPKDDFPYLTLMSLLIIQLSIKCSLLWMVFQATIRSRCHLLMVFLFQLFLFDVHT